MITLKENQLNTITFQKEFGTPLTTSSYESGSVYNIITYQTIQNNTGSAGITYTTDVDVSNPRWTTLRTNITGSSVYDENKIKGRAGTTYNLEVWYGPIASGSTLVWETTTSTWSETEEIWASTTGEINYNTVTQNSTKVYQDRVFISGSVQPIEKTYISPNENATYKIYQG